MQRARTSRNLLVAVGGLLFAVNPGCSGQIGGPGGPTAPGGPGGPPGTLQPGGAGTGAPLPGSIPPGGAGTAGPGPIVPPPQGACDSAPPPPRAVLLTSRQYAQALRDLLGADAVTDDDFAAAGDIEIELVDRPWVTTGLVDQRVRLAEDAVGTLRGSATTFFGCAPLTDRACVRTSLGRVGLRAYKRPLDAAELDDLMTLYDAELAATTTDAGESAALLALQALVSAPSTLYRTEFVPDPGTAPGTLSAYELAAQIGVLLLDSLPDQPLLDAAADGSLLTPAGLQAQIDRLLVLPRVRDHLTTLVLTGVKATHVFETPKDEMLFPEYTPALQQSMFEESQRFVEDVLWTRAADLSELLTSQSSFVDADLAEIYGVAAPPGGAFGPVQLPATRAGILTQASVLSVLSRTDKTSVVARGLFVRGALLCLPKVDSPPESVQAQVAMQLGADATQQELAEYRAMTSPCMNCHSQFDRFGLLLESFDPIGRERATPAPGVDLTGLGAFTGSVMNTRELAQRLADDGSFVACLARRTLAYSLSEAFTPQRSCSADPLDDAIGTRGGTMHSLISELVSQPSFSFRVEEP